MTTTGANVNWWHRSSGLSMSRSNWYMGKRSANGPSFAIAAASDAPYGSCRRLSSSAIVVKTICSALRLASLREKIKLAPSWLRSLHSSAIVRAIVVLPVPAWPRSQNTDVLSGSVIQFRTSCSSPIRVPLRHLLLGSVSYRAFETVGSSEASFSVSSGLSIETYFQVDPTFSKISQSLSSSLTVDPTHFIIKWNTMRERDLGTC